MKQASNSKTINTYTYLEQNIDSNFEEGAKKYQFSAKVAAFIIYNPQRPPILETH